MELRVQGAAAGFDGGRHLQAGSQDDLADPWACAELLTAALATFMAASGALLRWSWQQAGQLRQLSTLARAAAVASVLIWLRLGAVLITRLEQLVDECLVCSVLTGSVCNRLTNVAQCLCPLHLRQPSQQAQRSFCDSKLAAL